MRPVTLGAALVWTVLLGAGAGAEPATKHVSGKDTSAAKGTIEASVHEMKVVPPDSIQWGPPPPVFAPGAEAAVLDGDPGVAGRLFTVRLKMPAGYKVMPHWHSIDEHVTVISGEFKIGDGDTFDADKAQPLPAGGYVAMPAKHHHYAVASKDAVVQITGVGPFDMHYVNPADDPTKAKPATH